MKLCGALVSYPEQRHPQPQPQSCTLRNLIKRTKNFLLPQHLSTTLSW